MATGPVCYRQIAIKAERSKTPESLSESECFLFSLWQALKLMVFEVEEEEEVEEVV